MGTNEAVEATTETAAPAAASTDVGSLLFHGFMLAAALAVAVIGVIGYVRWALVLGLPLNTGDPVWIALAVTGLCWAVTVWYAFFLKKA